jgi:16S rRNA (guanine527-N7)-methyltransferase
MGADRAPAARDVAGGKLSERQVGQLDALLALLERDEHAPTAVRSASEAVDVHIADSLVALRLAVVRDAHTIADVGAGAGFPGLALAVALPNAEVSLIESQRRRCDFMETACERAGIANARVVCARVEQWREGLGGQDVVLARALAEQAVVLEYAAPLLRVGGTVVDWRGARSAEQERAAQLAAAELGLQLAGVHAVHPFAGARDRYLHLYLKVGDTPARFPRRVGVARKRPLGHLRSAGR